MSLGAKYVEKTYYKESFVLFGMTTLAIDGTQLCWCYYY